ncbi:hypothetical protein DAI22_03g121600 [Oryza sativa Japonica Group]|nr:hypothetical protein DAI22_03g121600 [Oryza sativa Japonica Group]
MEHWSSIARSCWAILKSTQTTLDQIITFLIVLTLHYKWIMGLWAKLRLYFRKTTYL